MFHNIFAIYIITNDLLLKNTPHIPRDDRTRKKAMRFNVWSLFPILTVEALISDKERERNIKRVTCLYIKQNATLHECVGNKLLAEVMQ